MGPLLGTSRPSWLQLARCFSSEGRQSGTIKVWQDERGFGFIAPAGGGEDVFFHRSALGEGVAIKPGDSVTYEANWDDKRRKYRANNIDQGASHDQGASRSDPAPRSEAPAQRQAAAPRGYNIVGAFANWAITRDPMVADSHSGASVRHRITVRGDAPQAGKDNKARREQFQIVGNGTWDYRLYPAGGDREEVVVLRPGDAGSRASADRGKGHGRNWAVEGRPGTAFDIFYDPDSQQVSCALAFNES